VVLALKPSVAVEIQTSVDVAEATEVVKLGGVDPYAVGARINEYATTIGLTYAHTALLLGIQGAGAQGLTLGPYLARNRGLVVLCETDDLGLESTVLLGGAAGTSNRVDFCRVSEVAQGQARLLLATVGLPAGGLPAGFAAMTLRRNATGPEVEWLEQRLTDLSYRPGPIDGVFDSRTKQAMIGFQKWEGLKRNGVVTGEVWWRLLSASRPVPVFPQAGKWIEIDRKKQVLLYCVDGVVERTLAVSTGSASVGVITPAGLFRVERENTHERYPRWKPLYLVKHKWLAIHGYPNVPVAPASHGCIRMTRVDMDEFHSLAPVGTPIHVY
jgi:hypothetical protein